MVVLTADSLPAYLRNRHGAAEAVGVAELPGGVSNAVFLVTLPESRERFVLKQARERLRGQEKWLCPIERIWREVETLRICGAMFAARSAEQLGYQMAVPQVLWEDRENFCYAMTAAPEGHRTWKEMLLAGEKAESAAVAEAC